MTELRRRMEDDMVARGFASRTRSSYLWAVSSLARFYRRSPDQISDAEAQADLVHLLRERQLSSSTCNVVVSGLRFLYHVTLKRDRTTFDIPLSRQPGKLPVLLSREEVERLIGHAANPKFRTMLLTTYAAGLRLNEVLHLRVTRCRFGSDDDPGGAGQRGPGPVHGAVGAVACGPPGVLDPRPPAAVAVSLGADRPADASDRITTRV